MSKQFSSVSHYFIASNTCESLVKLLKSTCVFEFDIIIIERLACDCVFFFVKSIACFKKKCKLCILITLKPQYIY